MVNGIPMAARKGEYVDILVDSARKVNLLLFTKVLYTNTGMQLKKKLNMLVLF